MKWSYFLLLVVLYSCSNKEFVEPLPDYMFEVFPANQSCDTVSYVILDFGDSTFFLSDTMPGVRIFDRTEPNIVGVGLAKTLTSDNEPDYLMAFHYNENIDKRYPFLKTGAYKFYDFTKVFDERFNEENIGIHLQYGVLNSSSYYRGIPDSTTFFYITGKSGDNFQMRVCGNFDVLMKNIYPPEDTVRVKGEYSIMFTDYFM